MPKPVKKKARKAKDENEAAFSAVQRVLEMGTANDAPPPELSAYMARIGRKGGVASGAKRMEMPEAKRIEIALKAARARWGKRNAASKG